MLTAAGVWAGAGLLWFGRRKPVAALLVGLAGLWVLFGLIGYPVLNDANSARGVMARAGRAIGPRAELGLVAWKEQNLLMSDRPAADFGFRQPYDAQLRRGVAWLAMAPERRWLLVQDVALLPCIDRARSREIGRSNRRGWWLVRHDAVVGPCTGPKTAAAADVESD